MEYSKFRPLLQIAFDVLCGLLSWLLATALDWLPQTHKAAMITGHIRDDMIADGRFGARSLLSVLVVISYVSLTTFVVQSTSIIPLQHMMKCYMTLLLLKRGLGHPIWRYLQFQGTDERNFTELMRGMVILGSFGAPKLTPVLARAVWSFIHCAATYVALASTATIIVLSALALGYTQGMPPSSRHFAVDMFKHTCRLWGIVFGVCSGTTGSKALGKMARRFEAWEAERSKKRFARPSKRFDYGSVPLNSSKREFRILRLRRRTLQPELRCEFITVSIDNPPPFETLSYSWDGEAISDDTSIIVNNCRLPVTPKVFRFLWYRRSFWSEAFLWIDAICINQAPIDEKAGSVDQAALAERNAQVALMGDIYRCASRTLIWLAHPLDVENPDLARRCVSSLASLNAIEPPVDLLSRAFLGLVINVWPLVSMFSLSYFSRIWIVQEVALAREVQVLYGDAVFNWGELKAALDALRKNQSLLSQIPADELPRQFQRAVINFTCIDTIRMRCGRNDKADLGRLLERLLPHRHFESTDPKDRIFGLLGVASDAGQYEVTKPNYGQSVYELYQRTARYLFNRNSTSLFFLQFAGIGYEKSPLRHDTGKGCLPSWVPDWTCPLAGARIIIVRQEANTHWRINPQHLEVQGTSTCQTVQSPDSPYLQVDVKVLDIIHLTATHRLEGYSETSSSSPIVAADALTSAAGSSSQVLDSSKRVKDLIDYIDNIYVFACSQSKAPTTRANKKNLARAVFRTLCGASRYCFTELLSDEESAFEIFQRAIRILRLVSESREREIGLESFTKDILEIMQAVRDSASCKKFCALRSGGWALCPPGTEQGDVVAHLKWACLPFVLRRDVNAGDMYKLVGSCFVYGVDDEDTSVDGWESVVLL